MAAEEFDIQKRYEKKKEEERKKEKGIVEDKKKVVQVIKLQITPGAAKPGPPIGPVLGQHQLNTADFCKEFNRLTDKMDSALVLPVLVFKKADKTFDIALKAPTTNYYKLKFQKIAKTVKGRYGCKDLLLNLVLPKLFFKSDNPIFNISPNNFSGDDAQDRIYKSVKTVLGSLRSAKIRAQYFRSKN